MLESSILVPDDRPFDIPQSASLFDFAIMYSRVPVPGTRIYVDLTTF